MAGPSAQEEHPTGVVVVVVGPTASGKTALAIDIARALGTDVVSADARQVYHSMSIGTAAPTADERAQAFHHLVEWLSPDTLYSAGQFEEDAVPILTRLCQEQGSAVLCGGSGMYVKAALEGLDDLPADLSIRKELNVRLDREGLAALVQELKELDPTHARDMDLQNPQRVVRALEVCLASGKPFSSFHNQKPKTRPWHTVKVGLRPERAWMSQRIAHRAQAMMDAGWLIEARALLPFEGHNALNTVGYKELFQHLHGQCSLEQALDDIIVHTRQFAKRQLTWFQKDEDVVWFDFDEHNQTQAMNEAKLWVLNACKERQTKP
jgi:tRNA dimethylallyltransferase